MPNPLAALTATVFLLAAQDKPADGWEIHAANDFCYMWLPSAQPDGTDLGVALDLDERPTIILANRSWGLQANRKYRLIAALDAQGTLKARGLKISGDLVALAAPVDSRFVNQLASASTLSFRFDDAKAEGRFNMDGAAKALASVRTCISELKAKAREIAKNKVDRETTFRTDPQGHEDPGAPPDRL